MGWDILLVSSFLLAARFQHRFYRQARLGESEDGRTISTSPIHRLNAIVAALAATAFACKTILDFFGLR